jgi:hypothetical protein
MAANSTGSLLVRKDVKFNGLKIFSATMVADRERLGEKVTEWMASHPSCKPVEFVVTQSSDEAFHCLAITLFYFDESLAPRK